ncbi:MAG: DNA polymerase IV, partial [Mucispirillum sp.]|nr:DNA polymerase IV [Mucispirillum sp.]
MIYMDMDAFFVSCEQAFKPYLKGRPISIGGSGTRGVVCSCSYEARKSGVRSGMSGIAAKKLCPDIMFM